MSIAHGIYVAAIIVTFGYGVRVYLKREPPEVEDDGSDFAYIKNLHKDGRIDDAAFEALVIVANEPDVEFVRVPAQESTTQSMRSRVRRKLEELSE